MLTNLGSLSGNFQRFGGRVDDDQRYYGEDRFITIGFLDGTMGHHRLDAV